MKNSCNNNKYSDIQIRIRHALYKFPNSKDRAGPGIQDK